MPCFCSNFVFCARVSRRSTWREEELKKIGFELEVSKQKKHSVGLPTTLYCRRKLPMLSRRWDNKPYHERLVCFGVKLSTINVILSIGVYHSMVSGTKNEGRAVYRSSLPADTMFHVSAFLFDWLCCGAVEWSCPPGSVQDWLFFVNRLRCHDFGIVRVDHPSYSSSMRFLSCFYRPWLKVCSGVWFDHRVVECFLLLLIRAVIVEKQIVLFFLISLLSFF